VVTFLKKDLLEAHRGQVPSNVRLLCFDTMPMAEVAVEQIGKAQQAEEKPIQVGSVMLEKGREFVHLGGDTYALAQQIRQGHHPHLDWFDADYWSRNLPQASFILDDGAGKIRQFGRLAMAQDLARGPVGSLLWRTLVNAIKEIGTVTVDQRLEIVVTGSFAGGTGSGMFIDIAWLARQAAIELKAPHIVRGYFALPRVFDPGGQDREMEARAFAAWRELNRFMVMSDQVGLPHLELSSSDSRFRVPVQTQVYDACYLVDAVRDGQPVGSEPGESIFPAMADAVSALVDQEAGTAYTRWVTQNLAEVYKNHPGKAMYSALATYTFKVPVFYQQQEFAHHFAKAVLDNLIVPFTDPVTGVVTLAPDRNMERGQRPGSMDALGILQTDRITYGVGDQEEAAYGTLFTKQLADIAQAGGVIDGELLARYVQAATILARSGGKRMPSVSLVTPFVNLGDDPAVNQLQSEIDQEVKFVVGRAITPVQKGEKPRHALKRIRDTVPDVLWEHYGGQTATGGEFTGSFGEALDKAQTFHVDNFYRLLRVWLLRTLNGSEQADPVMAKSGKLGYAADYLEGLIDGLQVVLKFLNTVRKQRDKDQPLLALAQHRERRREHAERTQDKRFLGFFQHPEAEQNVNAYLRSVNAWVQVRKEVLAHQATVDTVEDMLRLCRQLHKELTRWTWLLLTGDPATGIVGVYQRVTNSLEEVRANYQADRRLQAVQALLEDQLIEPSEEEIARILAGVKWELQSSSQEIALKLIISPLDEHAIEISTPDAQASREQKRSLTQRHIGALLGVTGRRFDAQLEERTVAREIQKRFPEPSGLANAIRENTRPFFSLSPGGLDAQRKSNLIRVDPGDYVTYFQDVINGIREQEGLTPTTTDPAYSIEQVGSEQVYKCTAVYTDDCFFVESFDAWHKAMEHYRERIDQSRDIGLDHVYPAERNAVRYEMQVMDHFGTHYRPFHPWVVMLLEDEGRFKDFFLGWAFDFVQRQDDGVYYWWQLDLPDARRPLFLSEKLEAEPDEIEFLVLHQYVLVGRDKGGSRDQVDDRLVRRALTNKRRELGPEGLVELLEHHINEKDGIVQCLLDKAMVLEQDAHGQPSEVERQEYWDLANLAELVFEETLQAARKRLA